MVRYQRPEVLSGAWCVCLRAATAAALLLLFGALPLSAQGAGTDAPAKPPKRSTPVTLETRNRALSEARLRAQLAPTAENERLLAHQYLAAGVRDLAFDHYTAALRQDPYDASSFDGLARVWRDWGFVHLALPHAYRAVFYAPDSASTHNTLGTLLLRHGVVAAARAQFEIAHILAPQSAYPVNNLCYLELRQGDVPAAVRLCGQAVIAEPKSHVVRNNMALALARSGDLEAAWDQFEAGSGPAVAAYNEGIVLMAARQFDRAIEAFSRARAADPSFLPALTRLKQLAPLEVR